MFFKNYILVKLLFILNNYKPNFRNALQKIFMLTKIVYIIKCMMYNTNYPLSGETPIYKFYFCWNYLT